MVNVVILKLQPLESKGKNSRKKKGTLIWEGFLLLPSVQKAQSPVPQNWKGETAALAEEWSAGADIPLDTHTHLHPCSRHSQPRHFLPLGTTVTWHLGPPSRLFNFAVLQKE